MLFVWSKKATKRWLVNALANAGAYEGLSAPARAEALRAAHSQKSDENRVIAWFQSLPDAPWFIQQGIKERRRFGWMMLVAFILALIAGGATGLSALSGGRDGVVNIIWVLGSLLGLHIIMLVAWIVAITLLSPQSSMHGLGALIMRLWQTIHKKSEQSKTAAARQAFIDMLMAGPGGRWMASGASHSLWTGYILGAFLMLVVAFSARHYVFVWETTILSASDYGYIFAWLSKPLDLLGFVVPSPADVEAAGWPGEILDQPAPWAPFILVAVLVYGLLPRVILSVFCLYRTRRALDRTEIELERPVFQALIPQLAPVVQKTRIIDDAPADSISSTERPQWDDDHSLPAPGGPVAIMGLECAVPLMGWPPEPGNGMASVTDLGIHDGRESERAVAGKAHRFVRLIVVVDLVATPDRGMEAALKRIYAHAGENLVVLLSRKAACLERLGSRDTSTRLSDWVMTAHRAGCTLHSIVALDLDGDDADTRAALACLYGVREQGRP